MSSIYVYDSNQWGYITLRSPQHFIQVNSVAEMVEKVIGVSSQYKYRTTLYLGGAGGANYQSVGAGANTDSQGDRSLQINENGDLHGSAAQWMPRLCGVVGEIYLLGASDEEERSFGLMLAVAKVLGVGGVVHTKNTFLRYRGDNSHQVRRTTNSATLDREAIKKRLSEYVGK